MMSFSAPLIIENQVIDSMVTMKITPNGILIIDVVPAMTDKKFFKEQLFEAAQEFVATNFYGKGDKVNG